jgi:predicted AlkP superfamily pyrophosphatase or phosphodiesterase
MRKKIFIQIIVFLVWAVTSHAAPLKTVLIISIDALHPAALNGRATPTIYKVMKDGAFTLDGYSTNPPKTLISHTAMFTGLTPDKNEKMDNQWQSGEPTIRRKTIFDSAKHQGFQKNIRNTRYSVAELKNILDRVLN